MQTKISVIIRNRNEERWIGHAIQSVLDFFIKPEIIIIDNNSTDRSLEIVRRFAENPKNKNINSNFTKIKIFNIKNYSPGKALNLGIKKCTYETVLVLSAHCVLKNINLRKIKSNLSKYPCFFGNQVPIWDGKKITKRYIWSHFTDKKIENMFSEIEDRYFLHNAFSFFNKKFLVKNKFDENLNSKEDRYWAIDVIEKRGKKILYDPEYIAEHHYTPNGATWQGIA